MIIKVILALIALFMFSVFVYKLFKGEYDNVSLNLFSDKFIQKFVGVSILLIAFASIMRFGLLKSAFNGVLGTTLTIVGFILLSYLVWNLFIKSSKKSK
jgi:hypothetical protein